MLWAIPLAGLLVFVPVASDPSISTISPSTVVAGDTSFWLTINGSGFVPGSTVRLDGTDRTTTFLSATRLAASITANDISRVGTRQVSVYLPSGDATSSFFLTVAAPPPAPKLISIAPATVTAGGPEFRLTVTGSDFASTSLIEIDGVSRPTLDGTPSSLTTIVPASDRQSPGTRRIRVLTPSPGGGMSKVSELSVLPK